MFEEEDYFEVTNSNESFKVWSEKEFISDDLRVAIEKASILILPTIGFRVENEISFPIDTTSIYQYFANNLPKNTNIEVCVSDDLFQELSLNSHAKRIGIFLVNVVILNIFLSLLSSYIYDNYIKKEEEKPKIQTVEKVPEKKIEKKKSPKKYMEPPKVEFDIIVTDSITGKSKTFRYKGSAKEAINITKEIKELWKDENRGITE